jgi:hypothetical protein
MLDVNDKTQAQRIFNNALYGVRKQNCFSMKAIKVYPGLTTTEKRCAYRGDNAAKCALGHSIPDDKYDPIFELTTLQPLRSVDQQLNRITNWFVSEFPCENMGDLVNLTTIIQRIHDSVAHYDDLEVAFASWEVEMKICAQVHGLVYDDMIVRGDGVNPLQSG